MPQDEGVHVAPIIFTASRKRTQPADKALYITAASPYSVFICHKYNNQRRLH